jgi:hypothetical protein
MSFRAMWGANASKAPSFQTEKYLSKLRLVTGALTGASVDRHFPAL